MNETFPAAPKGKPGYDREQVDATIAKAREQFANPSSQLITATELRTFEFDLVKKGGYSISAVDGALDRLEDAFAKREIGNQRAALGDHGFADYQSRMTDSITGRCERPKRKRFDSSTLLLRGYSRKQVDALLERIYRHIQGSQALPIEEVRRVIFKSVRFGYQENQVDAFIERVVELLQIERNS